MKLQLIIMLAVLVVLTQQAPSTDARTIAMSSHIVPAWGDVVKEWWVVWISLNRVRQYWNALQLRDQAAYGGLYTSAADQNAAKARIQTFYDGARDCLNAEWLPWFGPLTFPPAMKRVTTCLASKPAAPTFTVPDTEANPKLSTIKLTYTDDATGDIKGDVVEVVPAPTPAPTTATPVVTAAPYVEPVTDAPYVEADTAAPVVVEPLQWMVEETHTSIPYEEPAMLGGDDSLPPRDELKGQDMYQWLEEQPVREDAEEHQMIVGGPDSYPPEEEQASVATMNYGEPIQEPVYVTITEVPEPQVPAEIEITEPLYNKEPSQAPFISIETVQPEPIVPAEIEITEPLYNPEPIMAPGPLMVDESSHPEPETPAEIEIPHKEEEPMEAPGLFIVKETEQPEPEVPAEIVNTDQMYNPEPGVRPANAPFLANEEETPELAEHDMPEIVPTDTPIIYSEPDAPEKPEPAQFDTAPVLPVTPADEAVIEVDNASPEHAEPAQHVEEALVPTDEPVIVEELANPEQAEPAQYVQPDIVPPYEDTPMPEADAPVVVVYGDTPDAPTSAPPGQEGAVVQYIDGALETTSPLAYDVFVAHTDAPLPLTYTGDAPSDLSTLITEPPTTDKYDVVAPPPDSYPFSPASKDVPPLWALDLDRDGSVNSDEWLTYVTRLHTIAMNRAVRGQSPKAIKLLASIIDYHYATLQACIQRELEITGFPVLDSAAYDHFGNTIEQGCSVKFRYSLFAGAPPFQWIAKKEATVTGAQIETWFNQQLASAKRALLRKQVLPLQPHQQAFMAKIISCVYGTLHAEGTTSMNKNAFYKALDKIEQCAHSS